MSAALLDRLSLALASVALAAAAAGCPAEREAARADDPPATGPSAGPGGSGGPAGAGGLLLPPATIGEATTRVAGCLASARRDDGDGDRFPAPAPSRAGAPAEVRVSALGTGLVVTHDLQHPCCLTGQVATAVVGTQVKVTVTLAGQPCRCHCGSTLRTAVRLGSGSYSVVVEVDDNGRVAKVYEGSATVP